MESSFLTFTWAFLTSTFTFCCHLEESVWGDVLKMNDKIKVDYDELERLFADKERAPMRTELQLDQKKSLMKRLSSNEVSFFS